jgi:hypothetical protein
MEVPNLLPQKSNSEKMTRKQYSTIVESEPLLEGFGPARKLYAANGQTIALPKDVSNLHENLLHGIKAAGIQF